MGNKLSTIPFTWLKAAPLWRMDSSWSLWVWKVWENNSPVEHSKFPPFVIFPFRCIELPICRPKPKEMYVCYQWLTMIYLWRAGGAPTLEGKLRTLGLLSLGTEKLKGMRGNISRVQSFLWSACWKYQRPSTQVAGKEIPTRFTYRMKVVYGQSRWTWVLEELWKQWFAAVQKPLGPAELSSLT